MELPQDRDFPFQVVLQISTVPARYQDEVILANKSEIGSVTQIIVLALVNYMDLFREIHSIFMRDRQQLNQILVELFISFFYL